MNTVLIRFIAGALVLQFVTVAYLVATRYEPTQYEHVRLDTWTGSTQMRCPSGKWTMLNHPCP